MSLFRLRNIEFARWDRTTIQWKRFSTPDIRMVDTSGKELCFDMLLFTNHLMLDEIVIDIPETLAERDFQSVDMRQVIQQLAKLERITLAR